MKHEKIKKLVSEYIDGELKKYTEFVEEHIKSCAECSQIVKVHNLLRETLQENQIEVSPFLSTRIQARLKEVKTQQSIWEYAVAFLREVAIALILLLFILIGIELMLNKKSLRMDEAILSETPPVQKLISSNEDLSKDDVLELTLSNGDKK